MVAKRDKNGRFIKGSVANPNGRPKDGESWSAIFSEVMNMNTEEILAFIPKNNPLGREIAKMPKKVRMKYLIAIRVSQALMFEPSSGLLNSVMERMDGKVKDKLELSGNLSWKEFMSGGGSDPDTSSE